VRAEEQFRKATREGDGVGVVKAWLRRGTFSMPEVDLLAHVGYEPAMDLLEVQDSESDLADWAEDLLEIFANLDPVGGSRVDPVRWWGGLAALRAAVACRRVARSRMIRLQGETGVAIGILRSWLYRSEQVSEGSVAGLILLGSIDPWALAALVHISGGVTLVRDLSHASDFIGEHEGDGESRVIEAISEGVRSKLLARVAS